MIRKSNLVFHPQANMFVAQLSVSYKCLSPANAVSLYIYVRP